MKKQSAVSGQRSALDEIRRKSNPTQLDLAVIWYGDEQTGSDEDLQDAAKAAAELAALRAVAEAAQKVVENSDAPSVPAYKLFDAIRELDATLRKAVGE